jgi:hypothetical protein
MAFPSPFLNWINRSDKKSPVKAQDVNTIAKSVNDLSSVTASEITRIDNVLSGAIGAGIVQIQDTTPTNINGVLVGNGINVYNGGFFSNKNLLHNWDFRNPVNQRGQISYSTVSYTIDRWRLETTDMLTVGSGYITLTTTSARSANATLFRELLSEGVSALVGSVITASINVGIVSGSFNYRLRFTSGGTYVGQVLGQDLVQGINYVSGVIPSNTDGIAFEIRSGSIGSNINDYIRLISTKLEIGSVSTLAYDPPADYGEQLALCQRYFVRFTGYASTPLATSGSTGTTTSSPRIAISLPVAMRANPTVTVNKVQILNINCTGISISSVVWGHALGNQVICAFNIASAFASNVIGFLYLMDTDSYIEFSADL